MIDENWRYFAPEGDITPGGPSSWYILDWDQRRTIAVTMDEEQESEDAAIQHLRKHIDSLGTDVYAIHVSQDGDLISVSTNPEEDQATCVYYPPLKDFQLPSHVKTVLRSELVELDRLGPNVDHVSYAPCAEATETSQAVFKYYFLLQFIHKVWHEMNLWMRLPPNKSIVPLERIVLDELYGHVVGFTSQYVPGGTLKEDQSRTFRIEWLRQLTCVVDDLNLKYGIVHQDISARNLLINPETDAIMLFDFNYSGQIGGIGYSKHRDDVKGVIFTLYEIITRDTRFRSVPHPRQNPADVQEMEEWVQHPDVKLDNPVSEFRSVLNEWVDKRRKGKQITLYTEAPEYIDWPDFPMPPPTDVVFSDGMGNSTVVPSVVLSNQRRDLREEGIAYLDWERPAQIKLDKEKILLATGQYLTTT
ncbi:protein kinase-like protein [Pochonia chlamydosporia 170]|uniref:non-specific serine/threonine protein kinase n=1 Tax=Pochonia chlamydosporia 170 TaxID=1380566 RepID=A0A179G1S8_METCM|nr:protein kinase-like protein [Pochonia chlamydosporia 170]OAQ71438.1 protein kinase-like protein [Pochonia chlamydosporia 170]